MNQLPAPVSGSPTKVRGGRPQEEEEKKFTVSPGKRHRELSESLGFKKKRAYASRNPLEIDDLLAKVLSYLSVHDVARLRRVAKAWKSHGNKSSCMGSAIITADGRRRPREIFPNAVSKCITLALKRTVAKPNTAIIFYTSRWGSAENTAQAVEQLEAIFEKRLPNCQVLGGCVMGVAGCPEKDSDPFEEENATGISVTLMRVPNKTKVFLSELPRSPSRLVQHLTNNMGKPLSVPTGDHWDSTMCLMVQRDQNVCDVLNKWMGCPAVGCFTSFHRVYHRPPENPTQESHPEDGAVCGFVRPAGGKVSLAIADSKNLVFGIGFEKHDKLRISLEVATANAPITPPLAILETNWADLRVTRIAVPEDSLASLLKEHASVGFMWNGDPAQYQCEIWEGNLQVPRNLVKLKGKPPDFVRFFSENPSASAEDLKYRFARKRREMHKAGFRPIGATMYSCCARGNAFYGEADCESKIYRKEMGRHAGLGGCFVNGELGPLLTWQDELRPGLPGWLLDDTLPAKRRGRLNYFLESGKFEADEKTLRDENLTQKQITELSNYIAKAAAFDAQQSNKSDDQAPSALRMWGYSSCYALFFAKK